MPTVCFQPSVIDHYLITELEKGRVAVPFSTSPLLHLHISLFGMTLKNTSQANGGLFWTRLVPKVTVLMTGLQKTHFSSANEG